MIKMVIVDDEKIEADKLASLSIWKEYGIAAVASFSNPLPALEYLENNHVDIIISDISMPEMSGITFLEKVRQTYKELVFIFITAYNSFEYTHSAIINNVFDYIMKPVCSDDILKLCKRLSDFFRDKASNDEPDINSLECQQSLIDCLCGKISAAALKETYTANGIDFDPEESRLFIMELTIDDFDSLVQHWEYDIDRLYYAIGNILKNKNIKYVPLKYNFNQIAFLGIIKSGSTADTEAVIKSHTLNCSSILKKNVFAKQIGSVSDFGELRSKIASFLDIDDKISTGSGRKNTQFTIDMAIKYIEENYRRDISLHDIAGYISLSPCHTSHLFKQCTGDSFVIYLNRFRINKSKELLLKTNKKISEISTEVGFTNKRHFSRTFRNYTGISPIEYRNKFL